MEVRDACLPPMTNCNITNSGTNGGVMKLAGESRNRLGGGLNVPHIGIAVASSSKGQVASEFYETKGHTHLVLAVDRDANCPVKPNGRPLFGYEIEYATASYVHIMFVTISSGTLSFLRTPCQGFLQCRLWDC